MALRKNALISARTANDLSSPSAHTSLGEGGSARSEMESDRVQAMRIVFERNTDKLRQELKIEVSDLNSKLFSKGLISEAVIEAKNIDVTLEAMRSALKNEDIAEKAFEGFIEAVSGITSKSHLARDMSKALEEMIYLPPYPVSAVSVPTCQKVGLVVTGQSCSTRQVGENVVPPISTVVCGTHSQKISKAQKDSAISSTDNEEETMDFVPVQPSTDGNNLTYPLVSDAQGTISSRDSSTRLRVAKFELAETKRKCIRIQLEKRESDEMLVARISELTKKDKEIEHLLCSRHQKQTEYDQLQEDFISVKKKSLTQEDTIKEFQEKIRTAEEQNTQAEEKVRRAEDEAKLADERVRKAEEEAKLAEERVTKAEKEANLAVEKLRKAEEDAKLAEEKVRMAEMEADLAKDKLRKAEEKEENVEVLQKQIMKYQQEATYFKERANRLLRQYREMTGKYKMQYEQIENKAELAEARAKKFEQKLEQREEEIKLYLYKQPASHSLLRKHGFITSLRKPSPIHSPIFEFSSSDKLEQEVENRSLAGSSSESPMSPHSLGFNSNGRRGNDEPTKSYNELANITEGASSSNFLEDGLLGIRVQNNTTLSPSALQQERFKRKRSYTFSFSDLANYS